MKKPFQPAVGRAFEAYAVDPVEARTRGFLAVFTSLFGGGAVIVTGVIGLHSGNYVPVEVVWAVAGPMFGSVMTYYFGQRRKEIR